MSKYKMLLARCAGVLLLIGAAVIVTGPLACGDDSESKTPQKPIDPKSLGLSAVCPGAAGCMSSSGELFAGAAAVNISPTAYEVPRVAYFREKGFCPSPTPKAPHGLVRCGELASGALQARRDCGHDGVCSGDTIKTRLSCASAACPTGLTCNASDKTCYLKYAKADADGSEGDGQLDWFLDCGRDRVCPCNDASGMPAYFGKDNKTCLPGHSKNAAYSAPDSDGSEGNGAFDGVWMGGFDNNHPMLGKHDDIWARTLVLRSGQTTVAIVSLDLVGFYYDDVLRVRAEVAKKIEKYGVDYVFVSSTHAHEGPDTMGQWGPAQDGIPLKTGVDPAYITFVVNKSAESVVKATAALKTATLTVGKTVTPREGYARDSRDPQILDMDLVAMKLADKGTGKVIATLVNWGNHPEVLSDTNNYLSSDFAHHIREAMEKKVPAAGGKPELPALGGVSIYLQGAVGCLITPLRVTVTDRSGAKHSSSDWKKSEALGTNVAVLARAALDSGETVAAPTISLWAKELMLPVHNTAFQLVMRLKIIIRKTHGFDPNQPIDPKVNLPKVQTEVALIKVGPVTLFSLPGEVDPEVLVGGYDGKYSYGATLVDPNNTHAPDVKNAPKGPYLKEKIPGKYKVFVGLGNDELGYLVPKWNWVLGNPPYTAKASGDHYEETNSLGPETVGLLLSAYDDLLKVVNGKSK